MTKQLNVFLHEHHIGELTQDHNGNMSFRYNEDWLNNPYATRLSYSLVLRQEPFRSKECTGFFAGLLPEADKRTLIAKNLGISSRNDFSMLEKIGGDCAGAVTLLPPGTDLPKTSNEYRKLNESELAAILRKLPSRPLMAGETGVRLSLAGAQDKLPVAFGEDGISLPLDNTPSSHIIKPPSLHFPDLVYNEAICMRLAERISIPTAYVEIKQAEDIDYLLVTRYDRTPDPNGRLQKIHQEDFCQAFNISPDNKYQQEGGISLKQSFDLVRQISSLPIIDIKYLLEAIIFNFIIGNCDAHGKNFSLLYHGGLTGCRFAPLYDLVSTVCYQNLSTTMAMRVGKNYNINLITPQDFEKIASLAGLSVPLMKNKIPDQAERILRALPVASEGIKNGDKISAIIAQRATEIFKKFK